MVETLVEDEVGGEGEEEDLRGEDEEEPEVDSVVVEEEAWRDSPFLRSRSSRSFSRLRSESRFFGLYASKLATLISLSSTLTFSLRFTAEHR